MNNQIKERPILFSAPMVRAILEGRKSQTRIIIKHQPPPSHKFQGWIIESTDRKREGCASWGIGDGALTYDLITTKFAYGKTGDRLWVRETFARIDDESGFGSGYTEYKASCDHPEKIVWTPSIHMPRWASRILLEITNVLVERLQDISEEDAVAEGVQITDEYTGCADDIDDYRHAYKFLWESINGQGSWDLNPWVWAIEFKVITK